MLDTGNTTPPPVTRYVLLATFFTTVGGFLVGYDIGIVSGSMLFITPYFKLSTIWTSAVVSGAVAAASVSSLCGGWVMDTIGRRYALMMGAIIFSTGGVVMGTAPIKEVILIGRIICGLGMGLASVVAPVYVAEVSPAHMRGRLVIMYQMMINVGILISSLISAGFGYLPQDLGWRYMLGLSAVPGVVQFLGIIFMPESPRWLVGKGHVERAQTVLEQLRGYSDVSVELNAIVKTVNQHKEKKTSFCVMLSQIIRTPPVRRALVVGVGLIFFQQFCGINTAIYYSGTVLKMAGFPVKVAVWLVVLPMGLLFLAGLLGIYIVDKLGRRPLLIWSMAGTIAGLAVMATGFQLSDTHPPTMDLNITETYDNGTTLTRCFAEHKSCLACIRDTDCGFCQQEHLTTSGSCLPAANEERAMYGRCNTTGADDSNLRFAYGYCPSEKYSWITTLGLALFVLLFAPGMAPMPWTINAEIYPLWARGTCNSISAATCWISNLVVSFTFLILIEAITTYGTFWMFLGFALVGLLFFILKVPETKGKSLEQVEELFMTAKELEAKKVELDLAIARTAP